MVDVPGYRIQELLSWGAQGDVFLAYASDQTPVALKVVTADRGDGDPETVLRLEREARLLAAVDSPHVVKVREFLRGPSWGCLALEFLAGLRLDAAVRQRAGLPAPPAAAGDETVRLAGDGPEPAAVGAAPTPAEVAAALRTKEHVDWALDIAVQIASGAVALHRLGLVHRDLKPQNVMLVDGRAVLIDFGFARMDGITTLTQTGTVIGTLAYISPEQLRGGPATTRGDVFAIGATLWHCLCGAAPGGRDHRLLTAVVRKRAPDNVRRRNPAIDASLATVVARCLEPDPRDRYPDAAALLDDLRRCQTGAAVRRPFSAARLWRHHGGLVLRGGLLTGVAAMLFAWSAGFDARAIASSIRDEVMAEQPQRALALWQDHRERQREVLAELNSRLLDPERAKAMALALGLGLLAVEPRPAHRIALLPARSDRFDGPAADEFVDVDAPRALLAPPGLAWCFVMSTEARHWWGPEDPRCLHLLVRVEPPTDPVVPRSLQALPTARPLLRDADTIEIGRGDYPEHQNQRAVMVRIEQPLVVMRKELSRSTLLDFRMRLGGALREGADFDTWLRHPDEPDAIAESLRDLWRSARSGDVAEPSLPAQISFWEAHRLAAYSGCRLPLRHEWGVIATDDGSLLGTEQWRDVSAVPSPVDADPGWDRTRRGVCFANSNVSEWTLERDPRPGSLAFLILPMQVRMHRLDSAAAAGTSAEQTPGVRKQGVNRFNPWFSVAVGTPADKPHGLRLYRTRLPMR